ncbi:hypothetical protein PCANC_22361 [Puccinia coronata f. sp. avenae]|uniref:Uncharacterized protein n=1 Tax=Puccinia coronata f. sp. avenae TaxID=200324 RepID=A0A2N5UJ26_9BASI|nr:hypothetical protein PCANC_22361 [Puccinia coronata f. sp. avenae]PLW37749.1 hypothetical protein PCASD_11266 [Puccinia coronata f. sp. avenae]
MASRMGLNQHNRGMDAAEDQNRDVEVNQAGSLQVPSHPPPAYTLTKSSTYQAPYDHHHHHDDVEGARTLDSVDLEAQASRPSHHALHADELDQNPAEKGPALRLRGGCCCCDCLYDLLRCLLCCCIFEAICDMCC